MPTLEDALALALQAHRGQRDKAGQPYILHPLRVMLRLRSDDERIVALLHDVVEDTGHTLDDLRALGYPEPVLDALDRLSRRAGERYEAFVERIAASALAARVKLADVADNLDVGRLAEVTPKDAERLSRYLAARARLERALGTS